MNMKEHILAALREQFYRWEELLSGLSETQITIPQFDLNWSIQDVVAHLWGWQQISLARMDACNLGREPEFPSWITNLPGDWEEDVDKTNSWIYKTQHEKSWPQVHENWRKGYLQLLESAEPIPEKDLLNGDRYAWLKGYTPADVLLAFYDHHQEHLEKISAWLP
jgi:hypothetical protein